VSILTAINTLTKAVESLKKHFENDENFRKKLENEGVKGRLEIEDIEVLFLIRRMNNGGESGN